LEMILQNKCKNIMKKKGIIILLLVAISGFAQQDAQYTQYMYNTANINPAYVGSRGVTSIFGLHRSQWMGMDGSPVTNTVSIDAPIENSNLGIGVSFVGDKIGPSDESTISTNVSYSIKTSDNYKLSFGLKGTVNLLNVDYTKLSMYNVNDPSFQNNIENKFSPNIGGGLYFYSDKLYLGFSVPDFLDNSKNNDNAMSMTKESGHFYFMSGYVFDLSPNIKFKPSFLAKVVKGSPFQLDLSGNFLIREKFVIGAAYRWDAAVSGMAGFQVTDGLLIGYGYDLVMTNLSNYNSGSHELFLRFELFKRENKIVSPRFF
jgi:type IX secretion system PorP/SprF family membrane protein